MKKQVNRLIIIVLFLLSVINVFSQNNDLEEYKAEKGNTLFQISRLYNTTLSVIYELNPQYKNEILKIGDIVRVPKNLVLKNTQNFSDDYLTIQIVKGDTKFAISKKYNVSIRDLENLNPQIISMLQIGQRVRIPKNSSNEYVSSEAKNNYSAESQSNNSGEYLVKKGETLWGISKENGLTVNELIEANKDRLDGILKTGQYLRIPTNGNIPTQINPADLSEKTNNGDIYHIVQAGETKFGLSKKYQVSIAYLEQKNPEIVPMLKTGQKLIISRNSVLLEEVVIASESESTVSESIVTNKTEDKIEEVDKVLPVSTSDLIYEDYEIQPKETLYSLSRRASLSQEDFLILNPILNNGVSVGTIIKMPKDPNQLKNDQVSEVVNPIVKENNLVYSENIIEYPANMEYIDLSANLDLSKKFNITFIFSETLEELNALLKNNDNTSIAKEQYRGVVLAIDSLKNTGVNFKSNFLSTKSNDFNTKSWKNIFLDSDVIVGNFNETSFEEVATLAKENNKLLVIPAKQDGIVDNKNVIYAYPNELHQKIFMIQYLKSLNSNIIVVPASIDSESVNFLRNYDPSIKFAPLDSKGIINTDRFRLLLDKNRINYVVLDTDKNSLILSATNFLLNESNNYGIKLALFKSSSLINSPDISDIRLKVLQMIYPEIINPSEMEISKFKNLYFQEFNSNPSNDAKISFDITLDIVIRIFSAKNLNEITSNNSKQEHMKFHYQKYKSSSWNSGIFIIKYK